VRQAPRVHQLANQLLVQLGAWRVNKLRRKPILEFYPWNPLESVLSDTPAEQSVNRDPLAKAKFYQSLLDSGVVHSRAALARYLGTSRANVTQMLRRLKPLLKSPPKPAPKRKPKPPSGPRT
jgi:hypothetical protein